MSTENITTTEKLDVYARVTGQIITAIEKGVGTWKMPWHTSGRFASSPINAASRRAYRGLNTICLWAAAEAKGYESGEWATYPQWQDRKAQVRKGEKATTVVFWKFSNGTAENQDGEPDQPTASRLVCCRAYSVFNASQTDGYTPKAEPEMPMLERIERAERFFAGIGADVRRGGNRAYYSPGTDHIQLPPFDAFVDNLSAYATEAHEQIHRSAKPGRCDRQLGKRFGDDAYAAEEMIADLGAAFVCARLGLSTEPREDHAQYIQSWLKVLRADKRAIFTLASQAQKACDWMIAQSGESAVVAEAAA